ncbi:MAG TPA: lipid A phosphoethanolamine transferase [Candidatus Alistipes avicola]|uniref:Lipid A phosphoethanolamine transferase n=1 Tax=Candidatus Alistipes avicola TaxID=2838432 RepID=A0A9D2IDI8_9BACT|nr:phosphoethanolamine transferase [uncultured Alistipes sp.]HJA98596.1 lipid A phosphoethanolamine transferase [Candidatus Alistipes avicola]
MGNQRNKGRTKRHSILLAIYFVILLVIPNLILIYTEPLSIWSAEASLFLPMGFYLMWSVALKRSGIMIWIAFPIIILCAFQIILLYLFGNSVIATDMFTNVLTTNPGEAGELLSNIYPSIIIVCILYLPLLWLASREIVQKNRLSHTARKNIALIGFSFFLLGVLLLIPAYRVSEDKRVMKTDIFPVNVMHNIYLCASEFRKTSRFEKTSAQFSYRAHRTARSSKREIYVYIIGEAARAENWQIYGYERETTPRLAQMEDLVVFRNTVTQSNTTHKSVPLILSSVCTDEHEELFRRKGLPALFNEVGFKTWFITNQRPQGAMIDKLARDADSILFLPEPRYDMQLLETMRKIVEEDSQDDLLFILHCYGSHFSYHQRYPREFARFLPDDDVAITKRNLQKIVNAYDNSILYTDYFLSELIGYLRSLENDCCALLYCADHGEDLFDDDRGRFLHASPTTTFHQLYIANLAWFSPSYCREFPDKVEAARQNTMAPATTHSMFQTIADMASIEGDYLNSSYSFVSDDFDYEAPRRYLNDHNRAVPFPKTGLTEEDLENFRRRGVFFKN